jgi:hypothetical protein
MRTARSTLTPVYITVHRNAMHGTSVSISCLMALFAQLLKEYNLYVKSFSLSKERSVYWHWSIDHSYHRSFMFGSDA